LPPCRARHRAPRAALAHAGLITTTRAVLTDHGAVWFRGCESRSTSISAEDAYARPSRCRLGPEAPTPVPG
jgi:hypothetical protein